MTRDRRRVVGLRPWYVAPEQDWYFLDVAEAMKATLEANGLDEVPHQG